jgi:two-component system sensor histidine kinase UhpB
MDELLERVRQVSLENEKLFARLVAGEERYRSLARAVWRVEEAERRRLARELHDGIGQTLTALKNQLELLARRAAAAEASWSAELRESVAVAARALAETRELSRLLRPPVLDDLGLQAALRWLTRSVEARTGIRVALAETELRLDADTETLVFRVIQEALNNVEKHARARTASVELSASGGVLTLTVRDDGCGFAVDAPSSGDGAEAGIGLRGIRDRAELLGGRRRVDSAPCRGTVIVVELPLPAAPEVR